MTAEDGETAYLYVMDHRRGPEHVLVRWDPAHPVQVQAMAER